ncbi:DEAD/DEAH box helicase [Pseudoalteromonas sp. BDTF-M6]|uniref:DEAD/DEAH box helicase n=1 Tax=Pseudoalteromonas sp. BDTF-M6 TaxID=2796132 RepID=UPI001BAF65AE|nr:DEAD/DEAH box helicase [Pseudoalteromonas sp. BDTF-M6]MBS3796449.1 ATP-dependent RNA helicase [Pseudoalteromonas sp. BDTF-M6]
MTLPILALEQAFLAAFKQHNVIVHAPTGSGKSTCLPLWAATSGRVLVIQPRRIAATSLADYLAEQRQQKPGEDIGFAIRFEAQLSEQTQVVFATPGVALRWFFESKLSDYDVVMLDEFHERRWDTDLLLGLLEHHNGHRLIVTSATLNDERLAAYIDAKTLYSEGRLFPIDSEYLADDRQSMPSRLDLAPRVREACAYALAHSKRDILVFLPGRAEIASCLSACRDLPAEGVALHGASPVSEQRRAMQESKQRRIIFATNVAETSLTVPGIECVIDSGLERRTHLRKGKTVLGLDAIAKDSQQQRKGRCGRTAPGLYIALFGEHAPLLAHTPVEIEREALDELVLASACANIAIDNLALLTPPAPSSLARAKQALTNLGAIDEQGMATDLGRRIYPLPVDAELGYLIEKMPSSTLRQAMIDLAAVIATPAQLYTLPNPDTLSNLAKAMGEHLEHSDIALCITALRGQCGDYLHLDDLALTEAQTYSNYLRAAYQLPELSRSARFDYQALIQAIATARPDCIFVKRSNRRGGFGNGEQEIRPAKSSLLGEHQDAALVLATFSLAGKGKKHADTLATLCTPLTLKQVLDYAPTTQTLNGCYWHPQDDTTTEALKGEIRATLTYSYAGVPLANIDTRVADELLLPALNELILAGALFPGLAEEISDALAYHALYLQYHQQQQVVPSPSEHLHNRLVELGVQSQEDLMLIEAEDLHYQGLEPWQGKEFMERFPLHVELPGMTLAIEYLFKAKRVIAHYHSGERKDPPKRWELPSWSGLNIRYKKASKVVDIR